MCVIKANTNVFQDIEDHCSNNKVQFFIFLNGLSTILKCLAYYKMSQVATIRTLGGQLSWLAVSVDCSKKTSTRRISQKDKRKARASNDDSLTAPRETAIYVPRLSVV